MLRVIVSVVVPLVLPTLLYFTYAWYVARRARLALLWERVWPPLAALGALACLFVAVSWLGLWLELPRGGRIWTGSLIEILALIGKRLSDKEIARALSLATGTVHRHTANIYAKLGVNRRWDAVAKAQALGLLPR